MTADTTAINARVVALGAALGRHDLPAAGLLLGEITTLREAHLHVVAALQVANSVIEQHGGDPADVFPAVAIELATNGPEE